MNMDPSYRTERDSRSKTEWALAILFPMAWKSPVKPKENRELLKRDRFFRLLAQECAKFTDRETAYLVYYMMLGMIGEQLKRHGVARLPDFADIALVERKPRLGWCGKTRVRMPARKVLRLYPNYHLRRVFNKRQDF